ncbi:MAG: TonB-dependent receptor plug domain-containing protein [Balneolaceae bacterium]
MKPRTDMNRKFTPLLLLFVFMLCASSCKMADMSSSDRSRSGVDIDPNRTLIDHLRQFPSLRIFDRGGNYEVQMRGAQSITQSNRVLFVINRTPVGNSYDSANAMINMYNVEQIEVLPASRAQPIYGDRGAFGAVVITTK